MVLELLDFTVAVERAEEGSSGPGAIPGGADSSNLESALAARALAAYSASPRLRAHLAALVKTRHRGAKSGRSSLVLGWNSSVSHAFGLPGLPYFYFFTVHSELKPQPAWGCTGMKQRAEETDSSVVWSINCLEINSFSLAHYVILSINSSHHHLLLAF